MHKNVSDIYVLMSVETSVLSVSVFIPKEGKGLLNKAGFLHNFFQKLFVELIFGYLVDRFSPLSGM